MMSGTECAKAAASPPSAQLCPCASAACTASGGVLQIFWASAEAAASISFAGYTEATTFMVSASAAPNSSAVNE
jgi:hypothetical protein